MNGQYWLLQVNCGQPVLRGPYATDAERENEFDMCLIDPGTEYIIFIDPGTVPNPTQPHAWRPSKEYERERLDRLDQLEDE